MVNYETFFMKLYSIFKKFHLKKSYNDVRYYYMYIGCKIIRTAYNSQLMNVIQTIHRLQPYLAHLSSK